MQLNNLHSDKYNLVGEENYVPHFQPIVSTLNQKIYGYEVLGRLYQPETNDFKSLGAYFHNSQINVSEKVQIDRVIREKAIKYLKSAGTNTRLFFNLMPNILSTVHQEELLSPGRFHLIQLIEKYGINEKNIVIEITEDEFNGKIERLLTMVEIFRNYGLKIAIDDVGAGLSNLERIGYIHPDIIKIDIKIMRESLSNKSFRHILSAIAEMSLKLGSELLFEGVETEKELTLALSMGATLIQGFFFSQADKEFQNRAHYSTRLIEIMEKYSGMRFMEYLEDFHKKQKILDELSIIFSQIENNIETNNVEFNNLLLHNLDSFPNTIYKILLVDIHGYQVTSSYERNTLGDWVENESEKNNNYAWKLFFVDHKANSFFFQKKWGVSKPNFDIAKQREYVIFTFNISDKVLVAMVEWN
ncbi:MAG: EAL domain-containing protein [Leptospiraceae bacterium]|nr:EAL domain-containing protein [Leptospiraceae bacterium]MCP5495634.1 EAL domain-containing protein [Leptospiraceae bacterium]